MPRHGALPLPVLTERDIRRFWAKVELPDESGCMLWLAGKDQDGYGRFSFGTRASQRRLRAHRVSYSLAYGEPPPDLTLDHTCRQRSCVSAQHLEAVTHAENVRRGEGGAHLPELTRARWASISSCHRGHAFDEQNTIQRPGKGRRCRRCHYDRNNGYRKVSAAVAKTR